MANSAATFSCVVTLNQYPSYSSGMVAIALELVNATGAVVANESTGSSGVTRDNYLTVPTVGVSEAGQYRCRATVTYTGTNDQFVKEPSQTDSPYATLTLQSKCIFGSTTKMC